MHLSTALSLFAALPSPSLLYDPSPGPGCETRPGYPYQPLGDTDFRLLHILPDSGHGIECLLEQTSIEPNTPYVALSYTWGGAPGEKEITLNGESFPVTANLYLALWHLRDAKDDSLDTKLFWIDAISINQGDIQEKEVQIPRMAEIYSRATSVTIWLGVESHFEHATYERLFDYARSVSRRAHSAAEQGSLEDFTKSLSLKEELGDHYISLTQALLFLASEPWFERVWVTQEVVLARRDPICYYGNSRIQLSDLGTFGTIVSRSDFHAFYRFVYYRIGQYSQLRNKFHYARDEYHDTGDLLPVPKDPSWKGAELHLRIATWAETKKGTIPHDYVYGFLGIFQIGGAFVLPEWLRPNYSRPFEHLYHDFMIYAVEEAHVGLIRSKFRDLPDGTPSWVCDFRYLDHEEGDLWEDDHDKIVGLISSDKRRLTLRGYVVGIIVTYINPGPKPPGEDWTVGSVGRRKVGELIRQYEDRIVRPAGIISRNGTDSARDSFLLNMVTFGRTLDNWSWLKDVWLVLAERREAQGARQRLLSINVGEDDHEFVHGMMEIHDRLWNSWFVYGRGSIARLDRFGEVIRPSDIVCYLRGSPSLVVLRQESGFYRLVGHLRGHSGSPREGMREFTLV